VAQGFIIIQIGNAQLEQLCGEAIVPAIRECDLEPKRVDKHTEGGLLKSEIIRFIEDGQIIVADVTNERPNVYLEIGFTMGVDKFRNLILTVREDHFPDSPNHKLDGPRVHFDLAGYDILRWSPDAIPTFKAELVKRIRRRLAILPGPATEAAPVWDEEWIAAQRVETILGLTQAGFKGFMEVRFALHPPKISKTQTELNAAAAAAPIRTFGWPIALYLHDQDSRPKAKADGIVARITRAKQSFDYWAIKRNGDFYFAGSLFEDQLPPEEQLYFNTRIVRVTEALLYCVRLYTSLGVDRSTKVTLAVRHSGLKGRVLTASTSNRYMSLPRRAEENMIDTEITATLDEIEAKLVENVKQLVAPVFMLFDFFVLDPSVYENIVNRFVQGEVT